MKYLPSCPGGYIYAFVNVVLVIQGLAVLLYLSRLKNKSRATWYLHQFFLAFVASSLTMVFANTVMLWRDVFLPFQDALIILGGVALVELAYYFPENDQPREAKWVIGAFAAVAVFAIGYSYIFAYRYIFDWTPALHVDNRYYLLLPAGAIALTGVFVRRATHYTPSPSPDGRLRAIRRIWHALLRPPNKSAHALRNYAFALAHGLVPTIGAALFLPPNLAIYLTGAGGLIAITLLAVTHINQGLEPTSFIAKLVGLSLLTFLVVFGISGLGILNDYTVLQHGAEEMALARVVQASVLNQDSTALPEGIAHVIAWPQIGVDRIDDYQILYHNPDLRAINLRHLAVEHRQQPQLKETFPTLTRISIERGCYIYVFTKDNVQHEIRLVDAENQRYFYNRVLGLIGQLLTGSAFVIIFLSLFFRANLARPLERLLEGVKRANAGDLDVRIPVQHEDEIGFLTRSFNNMIAWLKASDQRKDELNTALQGANTDLELRVQARTAELTRVNARLQDDIAAREQAEQALRASELQYRTLVETTDATLWKMNVATRRFTYMGQQVERILGYPVETWIDLDTWASRIHPDDRENAANYRLTATERGEDHEFDYRVIAADGRVVWIRDVVTVVMGENGPEELIGFLLDVTEEKETETILRQAKEAAEAASEAKSVFLANMSHELRTPLNGVLGYAQILLHDQDLSARQHEAVRTMQRSGEHLLTLINDILEISRIESGGMKIIVAEFHLPRLLENLTGVFRMRAGQKGLVFVYETLSALPIGVKGDERRLRRILINLLGNAVKFTEQGSVTFKVGYQNGRLHCEIADTGVGIVPEVVERLFTPFRQAEDRAHVVAGTGLGLPISRKLIELMDGELHFQSVPAQGSVFWFDLDMPVAEGWATIPESEPLHVTGYEEPQKKVLIVDDKTSNRAMSVEMLSSRGFEVREAVDGVDAVAQAQTFRPDVILMDLVMPRMDGLEATQQIRAIPALKDTTIIAVSDSAFDEDRERSLQAGCDDFLANPFRLERLLEMLQTHLGLTQRSQSVEDTIASLNDPIVIIPPRKVLEDLFKLALMGKIVELRFALDALAIENATYQPFVTKIGTLAQDVKLNEVRRRLRAYLESAQ